MAAPHRVQGWGRWEFPSIAMVTRFSDASWDRGCGNSPGHRGVALRALCQRPSGGVAQECTCEGCPEWAPSVAVKRRHGALHVAVDDALHAVEAGGPADRAPPSMRPLHGRWSRRQPRRRPIASRAARVIRFLVQKGLRSPWTSLKQMHDGGHEEVVFARDAEAGLTAIIAIHIPLGPALGGFANVLRTPRRIRPYSTSCSFSVG